jgi:hypothetical protein
VPSGNGFAAPVAFEEFFASGQLRIPSVADFEPRCVLRVIARPAIFCDNALQVQLASLPEEGTSALLYVIGVEDRSQSADGAAQLMFAIDKALVAQVLPIRLKKIEGHEARLAPPE